MPKALSVKIYSTPTCTFCRAAKKFFEENGVKYADFNVAEDDAAAREMFEKTGQSAVPVIDIGGEIIIGYNRPALAKALGIGLPAKR